MHSAPRLLARTELRNLSTYNTQAETVDFIELYGPLGPLYCMRILDAKGELRVLVCPIDYASTKYESAAYRTLAQYGSDHK